MIPKKKFEFLKIRSTTSIIGDTLSFIQENFKSLFSALFYICGPSFLVTIIGSALFFKNYFAIIFSTINDLNYSNAGPDVNELLMLIPYGLLMLLGVYFSMSFVITVTFCYVKLYKDKKDLTTSSVWRSTKNYILKIIGGNVLVLIVFIIGYFICLIPLFILAGSDNYISGIFLVVILSIAFIIFAFYLNVKISFYQHFIVAEDKGIIESLKASYQFTKGIFWKSFIVILLLSLITSVISNIFQMPGMLLIYVNLILGMTNGEEHSLLSSLGNVLTGIGMTMSTLAYCIVYIGISLTYYSVMEERYGIKNSEEIDSIGKED